MWAGLRDSPAIALAAARLRVPHMAVFSGLSAAWLHGLPVAPPGRIQVTLPPGARISGRAGLDVHRASLPKREVTALRGFAVTSLERTIADLSRQLEITEAVVVADAALHDRLISSERLADIAKSCAGRSGAAALRRVVDLAEAATESPMETRLRMLIVLAGLPRPLAQQDLFDRRGVFLARPDLFYPEVKLGIEYDGGTHKMSLVDDNRRQNRLLAEGIRLLRFTAADVYNQPALVVQQVRVMLAAAANPPLPALAG